MSQSKSRQCRAHGGSTRSYRRKHRLWSSAYIRSRLFCEQLEERRLLSVSPLGPDFRVNTLEAWTESSPSGSRGTGEETNLPPIADAGGPYEVAHDGQVTLSGFATDSDSPGISFSWDLDGDGLFGEQGEQATGGDEVGLTPTFDANGLPGGVVIVRFRVDDFEGGVTTDETTINVIEPQGPVIPFGAEFQVNTTWQRDQGNPSVAMAANGQFVVVWHGYTESDSTEIFGQRYAADGTPLGGEFQVNTEVSHNQISPNVAANAAGSFVAVWQSGAGDNAIVGRRYAADGTPLGGQFQVNTLTGNYQESPRVAVHTDGSFVVTWERSYEQDGSQFGIFGQRYTADGTQLGGEFQVNTTTSGSQSHPTIMVDAAGNFIITWVNVTLVDPIHFQFITHAQAYDPDGNPRGGEFPVRWHTFVDRTAMAANGEFVVVWFSSSRGVLAQRFDASGSPIGGEITIAGTSVSGPLAIAMEPDGDFIVAWNDYEQEKNIGVFARAYSAAGEPRGEAFPVNTYTQGSQNSPTAAVDANGDFVIAWTSRYQDGSLDGVFAQRFKLTGAATNLPPIADAGGPYEVETSSTVVLNGTASDPDSEMLDYTWDLDGDGMFGETGEAAASGNETGQNPTFNGAGLNGPSQVAVAVRVDDGEGGVSYDTAVVAIEVNSESSKNVGLFAPESSNFFLRNSQRSGPADVQFAYGPAQAGWTPLAGDWNADGIDYVALYDPVTGVFFLRNDHAAGAADLMVQFGPGGQSWLPIVGDWDGDGRDTIGLYHGERGVFFLKNSNTSGPADLTIDYGPSGAGWLPVIGDWDGDGDDNIGLYHAVSSAYFLRTQHAPGPADLQYHYGLADAGWLPLAGDWNADGRDTVGLYAPAASHFFLRNEHAAGVADITFAFGPADHGWLPLVGDWDGLNPAVVAGPSKPSNLGLIAPSSSVAISGAGSQDCAPDEARAALYAGNAFDHLSLAIAQEVAQWALDELVTDVAAPGAAKRTRPEAFDLALSDWLD